MGIYGHQMAGFNPQKAEEVINAPEGIQAIACMALGYVGDPDTLPDMLKEREVQERARRPISEIGIAGSF